MHRWDSRLRPPPKAVSPVARREATGNPTPSQLKGPSWRRSSHGLYVPASAELTPGQRVLEGASLLPGFGAVSGWGSAYWRGVRLLDGFIGIRPDPLLLCLGPAGKIRPRPDVRLSRERLRPDEIDIVRGVSCTVPLRATFDGARLARDLVTAVVFIDMMLTSRLLTLGALRTYVESRPGWKGIRQIRKAVGLAVDGSRSPPESRLRLIWALDALLPHLLVNPPMFDLDGRLLGYPDGIEPVSGCVLEYDGDDHRDIAHHTADNIREEDFEGHGLTVMRVTRLDMRGERAALTSRMRRAHARGLERDRRRDRWTLQAPSWW